MSQPVQVLGIDVGGTKIAAGIFRFPSAGMVAQRTIATACERGGEVILQDVVSLVEELGGQRYEAVGLGICELVTPAGEIASANCIPWSRAQVESRLGKFGPLFIEADVRAAAMAEAQFGAGHPFKIFLYVTIGTGISSCLMIDGHPYTGARGASGTMASSPVRVPCGHCGELTNQTLEEIASGPGLLAQFRKRSPEQNLTSTRELLLAADRGEKIAGDVVVAGATALGAAVANLVNVLDPEAVVIGGGLGMTDGYYSDLLASVITDNVWWSGHKSLPIIKAYLGPESGLQGAAYNAWVKVQGG
jgi:glucokinase